MDDNNLTTKDAITVLQNLQDWLYFSSMNGGTSIQRKAIDMAIRALKSQPSEGPQGEADELLRDLRSKNGEGRDDEMRLIDADALKEAIKDNDNFVGGSYDIIKVVDTQPTVTPAQLVPAQWVQINPRMYRCSNCGIAWNKRLVFDLDDHNEMLMKYCPCCGKKMLAEVDYE